MTESFAPPIIYDITVNAHVERPKHLRLLGRIGLIAAALALVMALGCPLRLLTGLSCPGCGMTRAWGHVLRLDFAAAFAAHPLFPLAPVLVAYILFEDRLRRRWATGAICALCGVLIVVYLIRLISGDPFVGFRPEEGILYKGIQIILGGR